MTRTPDSQDLISELQRLEKELEDLRFIASTQVNANGLPNGGNTGQALVKSSTANGDATWSTINVNTVTVGTTTTGSSGTNASVSNGGTSNNIVLNFTIPRGDTGATGAAGADGKTILSGSGAPLSGTGNNGDYYVDTTNKAFYGPKASGSWAGTSFSMVGPTGSTGSQGPAATITVGTVTTGIAGSSASVTNSGTSSAAIFNFSIPKGDKGDQGIQGIQGPVGPQGTSTSDLTAARLIFLS